MLCCLRSPSFAHSHYVSISLFILLRRHSFVARDPSMGQIATEFNEGDAERGSLSWPFSLSPCTRARSPSIPPSFHFSVANRERLRLPPLPCRLRSLARIPTHAGRTVAVVGLLLDGVERVRVLLRPPLRSRRRRHEYCTVLPPRGRLGKCSLQQGRATVTTAAAGRPTDRQTVEGAVVSALSPVTHSLARSLTHSAPPDSRLIFAENDDDAAAGGRGRSGRLDGSRRRSMYG